MVNNRMWLRNKVTGQEVLLAKHYPSTGWYCFHDELNLKLDGLFRNPENIDGSPTGRTDFEIVYEENKPRGTAEIEAEIRKLQNELHGMIGEGIRELGIKTPACFESPGAD